MKLPALYCLIIFVGALSVQTVFAQAESASTEVIENCPLPEKPSIPNGRTSTEEEMLEAQKNMKAYMAKGEAVLTCLDGLRQGWGEAITPEQDQINTLFYNKIVDEMTSVGDLFNSAVRAYKGKQ